MNIIRNLRTCSKGNIEKLLIDNFKDQIDITLKAKYDGKTILLQLFLMKNILKKF